jgi:hypothetical protein
MPAMLRQKEPLKPWTRQNHATCFGEMEMEWSVLFRVTENKLKLQPCSQRLLLQQL